MIHSDQDRSRPHPVQFLRSAQGELRNLKPSKGHRRRSPYEIIAFERIPTGTVFDPDNWNKWSKLLIKALDLIALPGYPLPLDSAFASGKSMGATVDSTDVAIKKRPWARMIDELIMKGHVELQCDGKHLLVTEGGRKAAD